MVPWFAIWIAYFIFGINTLAFAHSANNYFWLIHRELPVIEALYPEGVNKIAELVVQQLPDTKGGAGAKLHVRNQALIIHTMHKNWLDTARAHTIFERNQLFLLGLLWIMSMSLVFSLHAQRRAVA
jgi:hypothetical protein